MYHFCTYFDSNYLLRGLTLYRSLRETGVEFQYYVLCLDQTCHDILLALNLPNIHPVQLAQVEQWDTQLATAKTNRSLIEYYFTLSPVFPLYVLEKWQHIDIITYVDADLYFYASPSPLFAELGEQSILVIEHRFPDYLKEKEKYGRFNVQYESFRRDAQGMACLQSWRDDCVDWCYDRLEEDRYADQKYLDRWPERYTRLVNVSHKGAGVAPWNWASYPMALQDGTLYIDDDALIFYHFHGVKILNACIISHGLSDFGLMPRHVRNWLYKGYIRELKNTATWLEKQGVTAPPVKDRRIRGPSLKRIDTLLEIMRKIWVQLMFVC